MELPHHCLAEQIDIEGIDVQGICTGFGDEPLVEAHKVDPLPDTARFVLYRILR